MGNFFNKWINTSQGYSLSGEFSSKQIEKFSIKEERREISPPNSVCREIFLVKNLEDTALVPGA